SSRRRHTRSKRDWSSDVCSSDLGCNNIQFFKAWNIFRSNNLCVLYSMTQSLLAKAVFDRSKSIQHHAIGAVPDGVHICLKSGRSGFHNLSSILGLRLKQQSLIYVNIAVSLT